MKIYYINKNSSKCLFNTESHSHSVKLYSLTFLPYVHLFRGSTQLYLIYGSVLIMAIVAAAQQVVDHRSKKDKMKEELEYYNFMNNYNKMLDEKYSSNTNADTKKIIADMEV